VLEAFTFQAVLHVVIRSPSIDAIRLNDLPTKQTAQQLSLTPDFEPDAKDNSAEFGAMKTATGPKMVPNGSPG
jgi:hypothetical protein